MKKFLARRPSASMTVAMTALVVALSGTAVAASSLVKGDKLIKKGSLSGNRLRKHTLTGTQINLKKLGKVPSAKNADHAKSATTATTATTALSAASATTATTATNAINAQTSVSTNNLKTWFATASVGQTVTLLTIGPFNYSGVCTGGPHAQTYVQTTQANSAADSYAAVSGYSSDQVYPFDPATGSISIGYASDKHVNDGNTQWVGPYDGSDTQISGDGHYFVNTFASVGTSIAGADCTFVGHAIVVTH